MQIAQDLLIRKLGDLLGEDPIQENPDTDLYVQHFEQPVDCVKMEAIKVLIEHEAKMQKKGATVSRAAVAPAMEA